MKTAAQGLYCYSTFFSADILGAPKKQWKKERKKEGAKMRFRPLFMRARKR